MYQGNVGDSCRTSRLTVPALYPDLFEALAQIWSPSVVDQTTSTTYPTHFGEPNFAMKNPNQDWKDQEIIDLELEDTNGAYSSQKSVGADCYTRSW